MPEIIRIESSTQAIPLMNYNGIQEAESIPLHQLADDAPTTIAEYDQYQVEFPFSNDGTAAHYFKEIKPRILLPEYKNASNRVAFLVGESSLMSVITDIPEETILIVDNSPQMCEYMTRYVEALRTAASPQEWREMMDVAEDVDIAQMEAGGYTDKQLFCYYLKLQREYWQATGMEHALSSQDAFEAAQESARQKAIITWCADITNPEEMNALGEALKKRRANITMMNLTNVYACQEDYDWYGYEETAEYVESLRILPVTPQAPILTSTRVIDRPAGKMFVAEQTGPFFGFENLVTEGGRTAAPNIGRIHERRYHPPVDKVTAALFQVMGGTGLRTATTSTGLHVVENKDS